jgi:cobalamin-independent methionine synthase catalytic subunit
VIWPDGAVTAIGSLPGTDPHDAAAVVFGELPEFPHLPELPQRGPGAEMIGRGAALLVDLPVEIVAPGWALASRPGSDLRRARDYLARDLDALEERADGYSGALKVQAAGPWTLAANVELPNGHKVVSDPGAVRDLSASLTEGLAQHLADIVARVPSAELVLQLDEPSLPAVLAGAVPTPSGYGTVRAADPVVVRQVLADVLAAAAPGGRVVHCCAADVPIALVHEAGADALALDERLLAPAQYDDLGAAVDAGMSLWCGVVELDAGYDRSRDTVATMWRNLGFALSEIPQRVVATPRCGLADLTGEQARRVLAVLRDVGASLRELAASA